MLTADSKALWGEQVLHLSPKSISQLRLNTCAHVHIFAFMHFISVLCIRVCTVIVCFLHFFSLTTTYISSYWLLNNERKCKILHSSLATPPPPNLVRKLRAATVCYWCCSIWAWIWTQKYFLALFSEACYSHMMVSSQLYCLAMCVLVVRWDIMFQSCCYCCCYYIVPLRLQMMLSKHNGLVICLLLVFAGLTYHVLSLFQMWSWSGWMGALQCARSKDVPSPGVRAEGRNSVPVQSMCCEPGRCGTPLQSHRARPYRRPTGTHQDNG